MRERLTRQVVLETLTNGLQEITGCLVGVWIETDGSTPGDYSWYEAHHGRWARMIFDDELVPLKLARMLEPMRTHRLLHGVGWVARGCSFNGDRRGPWVVSEGPYEKIDEAVDAAMAEYED